MTRAKEKFLIQDTKRATHNGKGKTLNILRIKNFCSTRHDKENEKEKHNWKKIVHNTYNAQRISMHNLQLLLTSKKKTNNKKENRQKDSSQKQKSKCPEMGGGEKSLIPSVIKEVQIKTVMRNHSTH